MGGGSWKVAYADFVTAMMAFFLLMWILNMTPKETKAGLAEYFTPGYTGEVNMISPISNNDNQMRVSDMDSRPRVVTPATQASLAIARLLRERLLAQSFPSASSGVAADNMGVFLHITSDLIFKPHTVEFTTEGEKVLDEVAQIMQKYDVFLIVRGHADSSETGAPFSSLWELSSARANAAVRALIGRGIPPERVRSIAYADSRPLLPSGMPGSLEKNSRVEFNFHRPEVMSNTTNY